MGHAALTATLAVPLPDEARGIDYVAEINRSRNISCVRMGKGKREWEKRKGKREKEFKIRRMDSEKKTKVAASYSVLKGKKVWTDGRFEI